MADFSFCPTVESVRLRSKCVKNRIGINVYGKNAISKEELIREAYSTTLSNKNCEACTHSCEYVDIFGVLLVELASQIHDVSTTKLYVTAIDDNDNLIDPLENNVPVLKFIFYTGIISVRVRTVDGEKIYTRKIMKDLLDKSIK